MYEENGAEIFIIRYKSIFYPSVFAPHCATWKCRTMWSEN